MSNNQRKDTLLSVLNLSPVVQGGTIAESFRNSMDLARRAEEWGYHRYWLAEHHNIEGVASSATAVLIGHIAGGTKKIRAYSGGIMLPNHSSLVIAEQFGTLETLYPGRIDLGLGRAPGTDQLTARALRRNINSGEDFPEQLEELRNYFKPKGNVRNQVRAIPGEGIDVPIWLLGSSGFSARLAGELGLPFAFAAHFSPANTVMLWSCTAIPSRRQTCSTNRMRWSVSPLSRQIQTRKRSTLRLRIIKGFLILSAVRRTSLNRLLRIWIKSGARMKKRWSMSS